MSESTFTAMTTSAYGMRAQGERTRIISENIANANTASKIPGGDPYARKEVIFKNVLDRKTNTKLVKIDQIRRDPNAEFNLKYMPDHPGANEAGYVKMPNVSVLIEMNDMREAQRSYEANLSMLENARSMATRTIDILR